MTAAALPGLTAPSGTTWLAATATVTAAPSTTPSPTPADPESVGGGLWSFVVVFALALVVWLLMRNMTQRLRRLRFREEERLRHESQHGVQPEAEDGAEDGAQDDGLPPSRP